jgi:hypothetical protein
LDYQDAPTVPAIDLTQNEKTILTQSLTLSSFYKWNQFVSALTFKNNAAPTPPTDILGTLTCRRAVMTAIVFAFCTHSRIIMGDEIVAL